MVAEESLERPNEFNLFAPEFAFGASGHRLQGDLTAGEQKLHEISSRNPKQIRGNGVNLDVGAFKTVYAPGACNPKGSPHKPSATEKARAIPAPASQE